MNETGFRLKLTEALKAHLGDRIYIQKNHGNMFSAGLLDLELCFRGQWRFLELKVAHAPRWQPTAHVTALQLHTMRAIEKAGGWARVGLLWDVRGWSKRFNVYTAEECGIKGMTMRYPDPEPPHFVDGVDFEEGTKAELGAGLAHWLWW